MPISQALVAQHVHASSEAETDRSHSLWQIGREGCKILVLLCSEVRSLAHTPAWNDVLCLLGAQSTLLLQSD